MGGSLGMDWGVMGQGAAGAGEDLGCSHGHQVSIPNPDPIHDPPWAHSSKIAGIPLEARML